MITLFILEGTIQYLDDEDNLIYQDDVFSKLERYLNFCREQGIELGLAEAGADIAALDILSLDDPRERISAQGGKCHVLNRDLREVDAELAGKIVSECVTALCRLDILVNNAGVIRRASALEFGEEDWDDVLGVNLTSAFYLSQAAARHFVEEGQDGKIVNLASVLSVQGGILVPSYA